MRPSSLFPGALLGPVILVACATTAGPGPAVPGAERDPTRPAQSRAAPSEDQPPAEQPGPVGESTPSLPSLSIPAAPPPAGAAGKRLAWVNPARCVSSCAFHPREALVRVNDAAVGDPRGLHQVDASALAALRELLAAARAAGHTVRITSAFRPYEEQVKVFRTMKEKGRAARPGHSEHQLGTTIDLRLPTTRAIDWVATHAAHYGFVLSYPPGKQRVTGYRPEPWHVRYVGREIAGLVPAGGTLEELFRRHPELAESGDCADCPVAASRASCGGLTSEGRCDGTVLSWCFDGARAAVDCAAFSQVCGRAGAVPDCVPDAAATTAHTP